MQDDNTTLYGIEVTLRVYADNILVDILAITHVCILHFAKYIMECLKLICACFGAWL